MLKKSHVRHNKSRSFLMQQLRMFFLVWCILIFESIIGTFQRSCVQPHIPCLPHSTVLCCTHIRSGLNEITDQLLFSAADARVNGTERRQANTQSEEGRIPYGDCYAGRISYNEHCSVNDGWTTFHRRANQRLWGTVALRIMAQYLITTGRPEVTRWILHVASAPRFCRLGFGR